MNTTHFSSPQVGAEVTDFLINLASDLEDESRDQIGTFALALFVAAMATVCRLAVQRKHRWWLNMLAVHGAIFIYWWNQCHLDEPESPWFKTAHGALCWRNAEGQFQRIMWWGGETERFWVNVLVWLAICGNVVPAYATGNEASRHMTHVKKRACNPLINHIIAGILCVIFPYFVVTYQARILIPVAVILDIYHQITIHRLIANHDGIWVLRAVSMSLAICKWIAILNLYSTEPVAMLDQIFILSTGFLGTRAYAATAYICYYFGMGDIKTAEWYSIGLMTADLMIMGRLWGQMRIGFWLTVVNCAAMHYHQMWKKWIHLRPHFVGVCCVLTMSVAHSGKFASLMFTIVFSFGNFILPHFNRYRPQPVKGQICSPAVSTRTVDMFTRSARRLASGFARRLSGFKHSNTLSNSLLMTSARSLMRSESVRSALMTPTPTTRVATPWPVPRRSFQKKLSMPKDIPEAENESESPTKMEAPLLVRARPSTVVEETEEESDDETNPADDARSSHEHIESSVIMNKNDLALMNKSSANTSVSSIDTAILADFPNESDTPNPSTRPAPFDATFMRKWSSEEVTLEEDSVVSHGSTLDQQIAAFKKQAEAIEEPKSPRSR